MIKYYVRVSTVEQKLDRQLLAYDKADIVYSDKVSGKDKERPQLKIMLEGLQKDDVVVVKSLDRLSRSTMDLLEIAKEIEEKGATLKVLDKDIDTGTAIGKFFLTIIGAVAELERENINQRVREGVAIAKAEGKYKGRKKGSIELKGDSLNRFKMFYNKGFNKTELSKEFGVPRATIYRWEKVLKERGELKKN
ncbi:MULTISPECIES: recombinase family protein [Cetobacterium]|uniref:recombinase family protein n=1 Tax=Cetobacterium TaxID=180162 RepID=UPI002E7BF2AE|nr:recombinase family protein [Cetobacterium somerae]WVJ03438.1 recombinase family protein [Cetobacterium somerae]